MLKMQLAMFLASIVLPCLLQMVLFYGVYFFARLLTKLFSLQMSNRSSMIMMAVVFCFLSVVNIFFAMYLFPSYLSVSMKMVDGLPI